MTSRATITKALCTSVDEETLERITELSDRLLLSKSLCPRR